MAASSIFTINGKTCSFVRTSTSTPFSASATSSTPSLQTVTALPELATSVLSSTSSSTSVPGSSSNILGSLSSTTLNAVSVGSTAGTAAATSTSSGGNSNQNVGGGEGSKFNVGLVVGIILALLLSLGVGAAVYLCMMKRRKRRRESEQVDEKSSFNDDDDNLLYAIYWKLRNQAMRIKDSLFYRGGDDQPSDSPFSNAAAVPTREPTTKKSLGIRQSVNRKGFRPLSGESMDNSNWFNSLSAPGEKLFVTNPNPPTPSDSPNPFADPKPSAFGATVIPATKATDSRRRSISLSAVPNTAANPKAPKENNDKSQKHSRRSTDDSQKSFINRGPSFYPPTTGPLPTFDDIQARNPFLDPVPALPTQPPAAFAPEANHTRTHTKGSSIVILPSIDDIHYDLSLGYSGEVNDSGNAGNTSRRFQNESGDWTETRNSGRASSLLLKNHLPGPGGESTGRASPASGAQQTATGNNSQIRGNNAQQQNNTMAWKFPSKTSSGAGYVGIPDVEALRGTGLRNRDTTYTTRSDPFDLEER